VGARLSLHLTNKGQARGNEKESDLLLRQGILRNSDVTQFLDSANRPRQPLYSVRHRDPHRHRAEAMDKIGVSALGLADDLDHRIALQDLLPQDA